MYKTHSALLLLLTGFAIVGLPATTSAAPIMFNFSGSATVVNPLLAGTFAPGDTLTGSIVFDSDLVDSNPNPNVGRYAPIESLTFTLGGYTANFVSGSGFVNVTNGAPGPDQLGLRGDLAGPDVNFFHPFNLQLGLVDATGTAFNSDALPEAFATSQFTTSQFFLTFTNRRDPNDLTSPGVNFTGVQGTLTGSVEATPVPEPATISLLLLGLVPAARRRFSRSK